jgi:Fic family protein
MPSRIEPLFIENPPDTLSDRVTELTLAASQLGVGLHPETHRSLAHLVRAVNCYYSNRIEGHNTSLRDIERALSEDFDVDDQRRNLQLEAMAHIRLQQQIDQMYRGGSLPEPSSIEFLQFLHREFYRDASDEMLTLEDGSLLVPGEIRKRDVKVGHHTAPSHESVPELIDYFSRRYASGGMGAHSRILALAAAHHRLLYIHPFADGNGRVARLMSHAMILRAQVGSSGLWSISRGMARGLANRDDYKLKLSGADNDRLNDLDGRGALSRKYLIEFTEWFLDVCLDQIAFMSKLFELGDLKGRLHDYGRSVGLSDPARHLLDRVLIAGEMPRGEAPRVTGLSERAARSALRELIDVGLVRSETPKTPVFLVFPSQAVEDLFPRLVR